MKKSVIFVVILLLLIPIVYSAVIHPISGQKTEEINLTETQVKERPTSTEEHYVYGVNGLVAVDDGEVTYVHSDHLGSNRIVTGETGSVLEETKYLPFGEALQDSDSRFTYAGKELDKRSKLQYSGARYYDSDVGRFTQVDPIKDGLNWYVYVSNNPMKYVDPDGTHPTGFMDDVAGFMDESVVVAPRPTPQEKDLYEKGYSWIYTEHSTEFYGGQNVWPAAEGPGTPFGNYIEQHEGVLTPDEMDRASIAYARNEEELSDILFYQGLRHTSAEIVNLASSFVFSAGVGHIVESALTPGLAPSASRSFIKPTNILKNEKGYVGGRKVITSTKKLMKLARKQGHVIGGEVKEGRLILNSDGTKLTVIPRHSELASGTAANIMKAIITGVPNI